MAIENDISDNKLGRSTTCPRDRVLAANRAEVACDSLSGKKKHASQSQSKQGRMACDLLHFMVAFCTVSLYCSSSSQACAPDFPVAIPVNTSHPDLPLKLFATGNLGVIQPGWAKSYLCVVYRYLTDMPLDSREQYSINRLWRRRLRAALSFSRSAPDPVMEYVKLRKSALGKDEKKTPDLYYAVDSYSYAQAIQPDAFRVAKETLQNRIKQYGAKSPQVKAWLDAQDIIFGMTPPAPGAGDKVPQPRSVPALTDQALGALALADRQYQVAAATFYQHDFKAATEKFEQIAKDKDSPWSTRAPYLVARSMAFQTLGDDQMEQPALQYIEGMIKDAHDVELREDLYDLAAPIRYKHMAAAQILGQLNESITKPNAERFGGDVGDLTFTMDGPEDAFAGDAKEAEARKESLHQEIERHDLTDWLQTFQCRDDNYDYLDEEQKKKFRAENSVRAKHALEQWRAKHSLPWLIAAATANRLRAAELNDLYEACKSVPESSPGYITVRFLINDALIGWRKDHDSVANSCRKILARKDLAPSARNLFNSQLLAVAGNPEEYFRCAIEFPPEVTFDGNQLPQDYEKWQNSPRYLTDKAVISDSVSKDLNRYLPLSLWIKFAHDSTLEPGIRGRIVRCTWMRAQLVNKPAIADQFSVPLARAYPVLSPGLTKYTQATDSAAKSFARSCLILRNFGMTPYLESGVERHGDSIDQFDWYNANYWEPLPLSKNVKEEPNWYPAVQLPSLDLILNMQDEYYKTSVGAVLNKQQKLEADAEAAIMLKNEPARFLGEPVFAWVKTHPDDPEIPEMLYRVVRIAKWSTLTPVAHEYSKRAYMLLHSRYPKSRWASKAVCYY